MPSPTVCTVSGVVRGSNGSYLSGVTVKAYLVNAFEHSTDGSLIVPYEVSTTTDSNGAWSLAMAETTTDGGSMVVAFIFPLGSNSISVRKEYTIIVPNSSTANFKDLI